MSEERAAATASDTADYLHSVCVIRLSHISGTSENSRSAVQLFCRKEVGREDRDKPQTRGSPVRATGPEASLEEG